VGRMSRGQMSYHQEPQRVEMIICNEGFQFIRLLNNKGPMRLLQVASVDYISARTFGYLNTRVPDGY